MSIPNNNIRLRTAITSLIKDKVVESYPGVLYVDEVDSLGVGCVEIICKAYQLETLLVPVLIFSTQKDISSIGLPPNLLSNMVIIHTEESGVTAIIKESNPRMICSVPALEKEIKFIDIFTGLNAVFGAGAVPSIVLAATNSEAHQYTIGFLIGVFIACAVSSLRFSSVLIDLQELVKDAKTKDTDKTRVEKEKIKAIRRRVFTGFIFGLLGIFCVLGAVFTFLGGRFFHGRLADPKADPQKAVFKDIPPWVYVISAIELIILLFSYMKFVKKIWKKLPFISRLERQKAL
ncbi:hypothetical protein MKW92_031927 [Papaver armeniacum]|nr:hypothetical protein MKW92_031927 [Papaver armeniacum]